MAPPPVSLTPGPEGGSVNGAEASPKEEHTVKSLQKSWQSFASSLQNAKKKAESIVKQGKDEKLELSPILKQRLLLRQTASLVEGRLRGNMKESEALHCCLRSQPCIGGRKRKFSLTLEKGD